jgi:hypothetical protein
MKIGQGHAIFVQEVAGNSKSTERSHLSPGHASSLVNLSVLIGFEIKPMRDDDPEWEIAGTKRGRGMGTTSETEPGSRQRGKSSIQAPTTDHCDGTALRGEN